MVLEGMIVARLYGSVHHHPPCTEKALVRCKAGHISTCKFISKRHQRTQPRTPYPITRSHHPDSRLCGAAGYRKASSLRRAWPRLLLKVLKGYLQYLLDSEFGIALRKSILLPFWSPPKVHSNWSRGIGCYFLILRRWWNGNRSVGLHPCDRSSPHRS